MEDELEFQMDDEKLVKEEIQLYQQFEPKIKASEVLKLLGIRPHAAQKPIVEAYDSKQYDSFCAVFGRRTGKSTIASALAVTELMIPNARVALISPTYNNSKVIFQEVVKHIRKMGIQFASVNNNEMHFKLEMGQHFVASSENSIKNILGGFYSMIILDETQDIVNLEVVLSQYLQPTQLDYSTRENGMLYSKTILIGTSRGKASPFYQYFIKELSEDNWKSFSAPTAANPIIPKEYLEKRRKTMSDLLFRQEHLAEWVDLDSSSVFFGFKKEQNIVPHSEILPKLNEFSTYVAGIDVGFSDDTTYVLLFVEPLTGFYYVVDCYNDNQKSSKQHVQSFRALETTYKCTPKFRFIDPSAVQLAKDYVVNYGFNTVKAKNAVAEGISTINELFQPTADGSPPRLYVSDKLKELIRQIDSVTWKTSKEDFKADTMKGTHWDLIAALRYAIYSYEKMKHPLVVGV